MRITSECKNTFTPGVSNQTKSNKNQIELNQTIGVWLSLCRVVHTGHIKHLHGANMAANNQRKHLALTSAIKAIALSLRATCSISTQKHLSTWTD